LVKIYLIIDNKQGSPEEIPNVCQIIQAEPMSIDPQISHKRKADQLVDEQASDNENAPPKKNQLDQLDQLVQLVANHN
jgi:hypothetical protein